MPEPQEHNLERSTPNRCCNIDEQRRSGGAQPAHEKVNASALRSELTDRTAGAHPGFGFRLGASEGGSGPSHQRPLHHSRGGGPRHAAPGRAGRARVKAGRSRFSSRSEEEKLEMET